MNNATVFVEILGGHGRVQSRQRVRLDEVPRFTIGRSIEADVVLDDPHVAPVHAAVEIDLQGEVRITDLDTINGVIVSGQRNHGARDLLLAGGELRLGRTALRIRTAQQSIAPERADHMSASASGAPLAIAVICGLALCAYVVYLSWLDAPRDLASVAVSALLSAVVGVAAWISVWALLSRILLSEWRWIQHAAILFGSGAAFVLIDNGADLAWFSFALPSWDARHTLFATALFAFGLYWHLQYATHVMRLRALIIAVLLPAVMVGGGIWVKSRAQQRNVNHVGTSERFFPPALRLSDAADVGDFFSKVRELQTEANARRAAVHADDESH